MREETLKATVFFPHFFSTMPYPIIGWHTYFRNIADSLQM